jgi:hypothetical protein
MQALEIELAAEKAGALARIARKLERHIAETERLGGELAGLPDGAARDQGLAAYRASRRQAELHYWYLMVQREAIGLRSHDRLAEPYVIPPAR